MAQNTNILNKMFTINMALLLLFTFALVYYVAASNSITSNRYKIDSLKNKINALSEVNGQLASNKLVFENPLHLSIFAVNNNMVKADSIIYLFESSDVAKK
jgi:hypothetical protein